MIERFKTPISGWSLLAGLAYLLVAWTVDEAFPFSRIGMYAEATHPRRMAAIPQFLADGHPAEIQDYHRFHGPDPSLIKPYGVPGRRSLPCSLTYIAERDAKWVEDRRAEDDGPVSVAYRYVLVEPGPDGIQRTHEVVWEGTAWARE